MLKNGFESINGIKTKNTCAFADHAEIENDFVASADGSAFAAFVKNLFENNLEASYIERNQYLLEIYSTKYYEHSIRWMSNTVHIDCMTGVASLFSQIALNGNEDIASYVEVSQCSNCLYEKRWVVPLLYSIVDYLDLSAIDDVINVCDKRIARCTHCRAKICVTISHFGKIMALEVEMKDSRNKIETVQKTIAVNRRCYELFGVIEYVSAKKHYVAHVKRSNKQWYKCNDLCNENIDKSSATKMRQLCMIFYTDKNIK